MSALRTRKRTIQGVVHFDSSFDSRMILGSSSPMAAFSPPASPLLLPASSLEGSTGEQPTDESSPDVESELNPLASRL